MHGHHDIVPVHRYHSHHHLGKARLEFMLRDNFDALNACFRDTVINILLIQWQKLQSGDRWIHGTVGIKEFVSIRMNVKVPLCALRYWRTMLSYSLGDGLGSDEYSCPALVCNVCGPVCYIRTR